MARLDLERDCVVIRIVYDGTARSGKTTTIKALGASLAREVETPAEVEGRTLYFDWLDYTGGRFDGRAIRCQVLTVPGQTSLDHRRRKLLEDADAVIFVADSSPTGYPDSLAALQSAVGDIGERSPPVGLVVQANQRDRVDAISIDQVRADCAALSEHLAVTESSALDGLGVRETFVFAVRLALDRVRELQHSGQLPGGLPEVEGAEDLFAALRDADPESPGTAPPGPEPWVSPRAAAASSPSVVSSPHQSAPWSPDRSVPSGLIWPPIAGRIVLQEATEHSLDPVRQPDGSWGCLTGSSWRLHSDLSGLYFDFEEGRSALIDWARSHATLAPFLSSKRCVVLARAAPGAWRLWQLVFTPPSLEAVMRQAWREGTPETIAAALLSVAKRFLDFAARLTATPLAPLATLDNLAVENGLTVYSGLFPWKVGVGGEALESAGEILRRHLTPMFGDFVAGTPWEQNIRIVVEIRRLAQERGWSGIGEILCRLLPPA